MYPGSHSVAFSEGNGNTKDLLTESGRGKNSDSRD